MASSGKPKTTYAKLQREAKIRERRFEKAARKQARKEAQLDPDPAVELDTAELDPSEDTAEVATSEVTSGQ